MALYHLHLFSHFIVLFALFLDEILLVIHTIHARSLVLLRLLILFSLVLPVIVDMPETHQFTFSERSGVQLCSNCLLLRDILTKDPKSMRYLFDCIKSI